MSNTYQLFRGGYAIEIEKEPEFFTAILPEARAVEEIFQMAEVREVRHVFHNVYKIQAKDFERDELMERMRQTDQIGAVFHHAYNPVGDPATRYYLTDRVVVGFREGTSTGRIEEILQLFGLRFLKEYNRKPYSLLLQVTKSAGKNPVKLSTDLMEQPEVEYAEPNLVNRFQNFYEPADNLFFHQWHLKSRDGIELIRGADVSATQAWDITRGSRDIVVAVIDDGFDITHPDLSGEGKIVFPRDFVDYDQSPLPTLERGDYHGTPCAGVAVGEENGSGILGVAPRCAFMPVRFDLAADDNLLFEIFEYAGQRAHVLSNSWGPVPVYAPLPTLLYQQLTDLAERGGPNGKGCVIVFAAGNYNASIKDLGNNQFTWRHPGVGLRQTVGPILNGHAAHPAVIAVAASTSQNRKSAYSNWGKEISVCAPSDNWHPLDPQLRLPGRGIWTVDNEGAGLGFEPGSRYTGVFGGTSSATPLVAGIAALMLSVNPGLTALQVKQILEETADKITDDQPDPVLGYQKGQYGGNGHSEWFGYGKVNAFRAVQRALELKEQEEKEEEKEEVVIQDGIHIVAALVNPAGKEVGAETVVLLNATNQTVNLEGWRLVDALDRQDTLGPLLIEPHQTHTLILSKLRLSNKGGMITLFDKRGVMVDKVSYSQEDAAREGVMIRF